MSVKWKLILVETGIQFIIAFPLYCLGYYLLDITGTQFMGLLMCMMAYKISTTDLK